MSTKSDKNRWEKIKQKGSVHYKTKDAEPIDLMKAGNILHDWCIGNLIKRAFRNRKEIGLNIRDIDKMAHEVEMLRAIFLEQATKMGGKDENNPS
jgi:hypothetical protein